MAEDPHLLNGLNVFNGELTIREVAEVQGLDFKSPQQALGL